MLLVPFRGLDAAEAATGGGVVAVEFQDEVINVCGLAIVGAAGGGIGLPQQIGNIAAGEAVDACGACGWFFRSFAGF